MNNGIHPNDTHNTKPARLIRADGSEESIVPRDGRFFTFAELYPALDCDLIEMVKLPNGDLMLLDENGKRSGKPRNDVATVIASNIMPDDVIVGDVVVCNSRFLERLSGTELSVVEFDFTRPDTVDDAATRSEFNNSGGTTSNPPECIDAPGESHSVVTISNDGQRVVSSTFWSSVFCKRGYYYLSVNAGAFRLLCPPRVADVIAEMKAATIVAITLGVVRKRTSLDLPVGRRMSELMFDDNSASPFALYLSLQHQWDRLPSYADLGRRFTFSAWTHGPTMSARPVELLRLPCKLRRGKLPCLRPV